MEVRVFVLCFLLLSSNFTFLECEDTLKNKFREREATDDSLAYPNLDEDELLNTVCPQHLELRWQTEVSSSVYASPLIADINSDGKLEVVVPSFVHYLEVLEGSDGDKVPGWPAFHQSTVHSTPFLYDIDKDGVREIGLATYNGEVLFFRVSGYLMSDKLEIPRLKVKKDWHVGLKQDPVDRSHPDVHDDQLVQEAVIDSIDRHNASAHGSNYSKSTASEVNTEAYSIQKDVNHDTSNASIPLPLGVSPNTSNSTNLEDLKGKNDSLSGAEVKMTNLNNITLNSDNEKINISENGTSKGRRLLEDNVLSSSEESVSGSKDVRAATVENENDLEADADSSFELFRDNEDLPDDYDYDDDYIDDDELWNGEDFQEPEHEKLENYVHIDAHVLCTPVIADIDSDGVSEMIVAVSYFFDHDR